MKNLTIQESIDLFSSKTFTFPYNFFTNSYIKEEYSHPLGGYFYIAHKFILQKKIPANVLEQCTRLEKSDYIVIPCNPFVCDFYLESVSENDKNTMTQLLIKFANLINKKDVTESSVKKSFNEIKKHVIKTGTLGKDYYDVTNNKFWELMPHWESYDIDFVNNDKYLPALEILSSKFETVDDLKKFYNEHVSKRTEYNNFKAQVWIKAAQRLIPEYSLDSLPSELSKAHYYLRSKCNLQHLEMLKFYQFDLIKPVIEAYTKEEYNNTVVQKAFDILADNGVTLAADQELIKHNEIKTLYQETITINQNYIIQKCDRNHKVATTVSVIVGEYLRNKGHNITTSFNNDQVSYCFVDEDLEKLKEYKKLLTTLLSHCVSSEFLNHSMNVDIAKTPFGRRTELENRYGYIDSLTQYLDVFLTKDRLENTLGQKEQKAKVRKL